MGCLNNIWRCRKKKSTKGRDILFVFSFFSSLLYFFYILKVNKCTFQTNFKMKGKKEEKEVSNKGCVFFLIKIKNFKYNFFSNRIF